VEGWWSTHSIVKEVASMSDIRILSWNVNGIRAAHRKGFLEWFRRERPDVLCIQETKVQEEQLSDELTHLEDYRAYFVSAARKGYSGVALYSNREPERIESGFGMTRFDEEGRTLVADYSDFLLYNVYFPNGKASKERLQFKMEFYDAFAEHVKALVERGKRIVVCGDVNTAHREIDLARPRENEKISGFLPEERAWIDRFIESGFVDTFRLYNQDPGQYTWWDLKTRARERNVGWRIDYFFISENLKDSLKSASILTEVQGSDHCPIAITLSL
jgi:exodeoxyribonuclease-3